MKKTDQPGSRETLRVIGLMSGTSADGIDAAACDVSGDGVTVLAFETFPYPPAVRREVLAQSDPATSSVDRICRLNFALGERFADAAIQLCERHGVPLASIDLIGSHGQTIYHIADGRARATLQIGEPSIIAERTGVTTVADFRPRDIAAGGQGAPLVPYADFVLLRHPTITRAVQNIGGIANVTFLPAGGSIEDVIAFDTGPGNMVMDAIVSELSAGRRTFDRDGQLAAAGTVCAPLLEELLRHPYFRRRPPKTTGREMFGAAFTKDVLTRARRRKLSGADAVATATALTARSIAEAYHRFLPTLPDETILCGGGSRNATLAAMIAAELAPAPVRVIDELGIDADAKEAVSFAVLAAATVRGQPNNVPSATGAARAVVLGKIVP